MQKKGADMEHYDFNSSEFVKWFSELDKSSGNVAGGKGANLAEIFNLKVQVPPGFVVTAQAYDYFIEKAGLKNKLKSILENLDNEDTKRLDEVSKEIKELIINSELPKEMQEEIFEAYCDLGIDHENLKNITAHALIGKNADEIFVAVRSSATAEDLAEASFAGQQESFLNVKGKSSLIRHIKKCFASLFTSRAIYYRNKNKFKHEDVKLAVVVQKMVDSEKSGVIFSKDPSFNNENIIIEAVFGLGEGIVSGLITPDKYLVSRDLKITDKKIADKKVALTRDSSGEQEEVSLTESKSKSQVLKEHEIIKLAEYALKLEKHYKKPQDIEFAIEGGNIFIVQTRPITTLGKIIEEKSEKILGEIILTGLGASPGIGAGKVKIVKEISDLQKIIKGDILVTKMTNPDMVVSMQKCSAIITDEGGITAHASIVSREMGIPAVVGTQEATIKLKDGDIVTVDGFNGKVYKGKVSDSVQKEILPITAKTRTKIKINLDLPNFVDRALKTNAKRVGLVRIEGIIAESGKHPNYFLQKNRLEDYEKIIFDGIYNISKSFEETWVRTSDIRSDEFKDLEGSPKNIEANPMLGMHGIRYSLKNIGILNAELNALKKVANKGIKLGVLLPQVISVEELQKVKGILEEMKFSNIRVGIMIETPAAVQLIKEFCSEGIDFISFGTNDLTQYILAVDRGNQEVQNLYDEMHPAIQYQIEYVIRVCKRNNVETSICGQAGSKKEMVKFLVEKGIDSISINLDSAKEISDYIEEIEKELLSGTDEELRKYQPDENSKSNEIPIINGADKINGLPETISNCQELEVLEHPKNARDEMSIFAVPNYKEIKNNLEIKKEIQGNILPGGENLFPSFFE